MRRVLGYLGLVALVVAALNFLWLFGESIKAAETRSTASSATVTTTSAATA